MKLDLKAKTFSLSWGVLALIGYLVLSHITFLYFDFVLLIKSNMILIKYFVEACNSSVIVVDDHIYVSNGIVRITKACSYVDILIFSMIIGCSVYDRLFFLTSIYLINLIRILIAVYGYDSQYEWAIIHDLIDHCLWASLLILLSLYWINKKVDLLPLNHYLSQKIKTCLKKIYINY